MNKHSKYELTQSFQSDTQHLKHCAWSLSVRNVKASFGVFVVLQTFVCKVKRKEHKN